jgi:hypothetical protein
MSKPVVDETKKAFKQGKKKYDDAMKMIDRDSKEVLKSLEKTIKNSDQASIAMIQDQIEEAIK